MFPIVFYQEILKRGKKLSDIEFLAIKEFNGKLRSDEGFLSAIGDLATLTANTGKDMYLARAKVTFFMNNFTGASVTEKCELKLNGTTIETARASITQSTIDSGTSTIIYEFKNIGHKVLSGEIIKLEVIVNDSDVDIEGFIECFEEDTNDTPQITSI